MASFRPSFLAQPPVSVMLSVYYCAAFDSKAGDRRAHALTHLAAVYFSISALPHCSDPLFFIAMAAVVTIWGAFLPETATPENNFIA